MGKWTNLAYSVRATVKKDLLAIKRKEKS